MAGAEGVRKLSGITTLMGVTLRLSGTRRYSFGRLPITVLHVSLTSAPRHVLGAHGPESPDASVMWGGECAGALHLDFHAPVHGVSGGFSVRSDQLLSLTVILGKHQNTRSRNPSFKSGFARQCV